MNGFAAKLLRGKSPKGPKGHRPTLLVGLMTACIASMLVGAVYFPVSWQMRQRSSPIKAAGCLKSIGLAMQLYANSANSVNGAPPPALPTPAPAPMSSTALAPTPAPGTRPAGDVPSDPAALWALLRAGGQLVLVRHAATPPGSGEPANFNLSDRSTQRNLSDAGREQARRVGEAFRRQSVPVGRVLTSQYFRCRDTASLAFGSEVPEPLLNGLPDDAARAKKQVAALRKLAAEKPPSGNTVLVTHQGNIVALTGIKPEPGECVVLTPEGDGGFRVVGRLKADEAQRR